MEQPEPLARKTRGEHHLSITISYELKCRLKAIADRHDRTIADMVRAVLKIGIPMMEGISESEELMIHEYVDMFRRLRRLKSLKDI